MDINNFRRWWNTRKHTFANHTTTHNDSSQRTASRFHGVPTTSSIPPFSSPSDAAQSSLPSMIRLAAIPIQSSLDPHQDTYMHTKRVLFKCTNEATRMTAEEPIMVAHCIAWKRAQFESTVQGRVYSSSSRVAHHASSCLATAGVGNKNRCKIKKISIENMTF